MPSRLLIVDDEEAILFAMKSYFEARGYEVDGARDPAEANALLRHRHHVVVIVDLRLSASHQDGGLQIIASARKSNPAARVILLTAFGTTEIEEEAYRLGAHVCLHKPLPLAEVEQCIRDLMLRKD